LVLPVVWEAKKGFATGPVTAGLLSAGSMAARYLNASALYREKRLKVLARDPAKPKPQARIIAA
jgi:hypothetical protein